jgi:hypothetical protein
MFRKIDGDKKGFVRPRRLIASSSETVDISKLNSSHTESEQVREVKETIKKQVKLYNKLSKFEADIDDEFESLKVQVPGTHGALIRAVQSMDPDSEGLYISYSLYKRCLALKASTSRYVNLDIADSYTGVPEVDSQFLAMEKGKKLDIPEEVLKIIATHLGMQLLAIFKNSAFMRGINGLSTSKYGGLSTESALPADLAAFAATMAIEFGMNNFPEMNGMLGTLNTELSDQLDTQGATEQGVKEREEARNAKLKSDNLINGNSMVNHEVILEYMATFTIEANAGILTNAVGSATGSNTSSKPTANQDTTRLMYKEIVSEQKVDLENQHKQQKTYHGNITKNAKKELVDEHGEEAMPYTEELDRKSEVDKSEGFTNVFKSAYKTFAGEDAEEEPNVIKEKQDVTNAIMDANNVMLDVMGYMAQIMNALPIELICCLTKFFAALDIEVLDKIRMLLSMSRNGVKLDLGSIFNLLRSERNKALTRLILEPLIDLINKFFKTVIDGIKEWLNKGLEEWNDLTNNCLSLDFLVEYIVEYISKKQKELVKLIATHFDEMIKTKDLGFAVLSVKADNDILNRLLDILNAVIDAKKRGSICKDGEGPTEEELEGFIRGFLGENKTPFNLSGSSTGDPFLDFNTDFKFETSVGISLPMDISDNGKIDRNSEEAFGRTMSDCAKKISPDLIVKFTEFRGRIRNIDDE